MAKVAKPVPEKGTVPTLRIILESRLGTFRKVHPSAIQVQGCRRTSPLLEAREVWRKENAELRM